MQSVQICTETPDARRDGYPRAACSRKRLREHQTIRSQQLIGEGLNAMQEQGTLATRGRPIMSTGGTLKLEDIGITRNQSSKFKRVALLSQEELKALRDECKSKGLLQHGVETGNQSQPTGL